MGNIGKLEAAWIKEGLLPTGIDEVGKGCLAGPVYAGAVTLNYELLFQLPKKNRLLIRDSKTLSAKQRQTASTIIKEISIDSSVGFASTQEIESFGIMQATYLAMQRALEKLVKFPNFLIIDGNKILPKFKGRQETIIKGDNLCHAIAAASILAKVARDQFMIEQSQNYPYYGFETHVGYGTKRHLDSIKAFGICPLHRKNFAPIKNSVLNCESN